MTPSEPGCYPVLIAASPYSRQIQNLGAPADFIEAGASDFFVPKVPSLKRGHFGQYLAYKLKREDEMAVYEMGMVGLSNQKSNTFAVLLCGALSDFQCLTLCTGRASLYLHVL